MGPGQGCQIEQIKIHGNIALCLLLSEWYSVYLKFNFIGHLIFSPAALVEKSPLKGRGAHFRCQSIKKRWVLIPENELGNGAFVPTSLLLVLVSGVYRSLASLVVGEVASGSATWNGNQAGSQ